MGTLDIYRRLKRYKPSSGEIGGRRKDQRKIDRFISLQEELGLGDIRFKGQMHTWSNNWGGDERVEERLDRVLANETWCARYLRAQCLNGLAIRSDHSPITLVLGYSDSKGRRSFNFEEMWLKQLEFFKVIKAAWSQGKYSKGGGSKTQNGQLHNGTHWME